MNSVADIWSNVVLQLQHDLSEITIRTWFDELDAVDFRDGTLYLYCPNEFKTGYIKSLYMNNIKAALRELFSADIAVTVLDEEGLKSFRGDAAPAADGKDELTFDSFVVGPENKLAYSAAKAVAESPA